MASSFDPRYPSVVDLREKARRKMPGFAFEYFDGGCNEDVCIGRNASEIREVQLQPRYLRNYGTSSTKTKLLGMEFDAPAGKFTLMGGPFIYGVGALGKRGGHHTLNVLKF